MKAYRQRILIFEERLTELLQKLEDPKSNYTGNIWTIRQRYMIIRMYNLNLSLLKLWNPEENRKPIS
jgi:hypothetical protein